MISVSCRLWLARRRGFAHSPLSPLFRSRGRRSSSQDYHGCSYDLGCPYYHRCPHNHLGQAYHFVFVQRCPNNDDDHVVQGCFDHLDHHQGRLQPVAVWKRCCWVSLEPCRIFAERSLTFSLQSHHDVQGFHHDHDHHHYDYHYHYYLGPAHDDQCPSSSVDSRPSPVAPSRRQPRPAGSRARLHQRVRLARLARH